MLDRTMDSDLDVPASEEGQTICQHLRNKRMSYLPRLIALLPPPEHEASRIGTGAHHWCERTHRSVGPDGSTVSVKRCRPGRRCHC